MKYLILISIVLVSGCYSTHTTTSIYPDGRVEICVTTWYYTYYNWPGREVEMKEECKYIEEDKI